MKLTLNKQLADVRAEASGRRICETATLWGHTFELQTLIPSEDDWVQARACGHADGVLAVTLVMPRYRIAAALKSFDGVSVHDMFVPETDEDRAAFAVLPAAERANMQRNNVYDFLCDLLVDWQFVELHKVYEGLMVRQRKALEGLNPLAKSPSKS